MLLVTNKLKLLILPPVFFILSGCLSPAAKEYSGFFKSYDQFREPNNGNLDRIWTAPEIKGDASFSALLASYDSVMVDPVTVYFAQRDAYDGIEPGQLKILADTFRSEVEKALRSRYRLVSKPSKTTMRVSFALTGVTTPNKILAATSTFNPVGLGVSLLSKEITGDHLNVGTASMEIVFADSLSGRSLFAAIDERSGEKDLGSITSSLDDARDVFRWWGQNLRNTLNNY